MTDNLRAINKLWDSLNPQKNLDEHYERITKAKLSQKVRESQLVKLTTAKIICSYWILTLVTLLVVTFALIATSYYSTF